MAKRTRGSSIRPGQRARLQRPTGSRAAAAPAPATTPTPRPAELTADEEARAAELEAQIVAEEKAAAEATRKTRDRTRRATDDAPARGGTIAMRAADEYAYVVRDLRRIALIGGSLVLFLIGLWAVVEATGMGPF